MNELSIPATIIFYVLKRKSDCPKFQIKLSQTSKAMLKFVRKVRGYHFDYLKISSDYSKFKAECWHYFITVYSNANDIILLNKRISVKTLLKVINLRGKKGKLIFEKIDISKFVGTLQFEKCDLTKNEIKIISKSSAQKLEWHNSHYSDSCDAFYYFLKNMNNLKEISFFWQNGVTSFDAVANLKRNNKLKICEILNITEPIDPILIEKFIRNNMSENGRLKLLFTNYLPPENAKKLEKIKDIFCIQIMFSSAMSKFSEEIENDL